MDQQMFDFTIKEKINEGYNEKINKYLQYFTKEDRYTPVIPIVISFWLKMHKGFVASMWPSTVTCEVFLKNLLSGLLISRLLS